MIKAKIPAENPDANLKSYTETHQRFTSGRIHTRISPGIEPAN